MYLNICHYLTLRKSVKLLAVIDAVFSVLLIGLMTLPLIRPQTFPDAPKMEFTKLFPIAVRILSVALALLQILLAIRLYRGAKYSDYRLNWKLWTRAKVVLLTIYIFGYVGLLVNMPSKTPFERTYFGSTGLIIALTLFVVFIVLLTGFCEDRRVDHAIGHTLRPRHSEHHLVPRNSKFEHEYKTHVDFISPQNTTDFAISSHVV
ncbi:unnamed protein product [Orchesella dallaii]|uniref:Uncharacterized protein n=1 Tax=Orchesella dallaii TaxID=48710 RepID=A0ABP1Q3T2_9HEXA